jgi:hypothetical protein
MRRLLAAAAVLAILVLAYAVWPTPYRYIGMYDHGLVRMNRFSGRAAILTDSGWTALDRDPFSDLRGKLNGH